MDTDFAGGWNPEEAGDANNVYSRTGFIIYYAGCPVYWQSKLQTEIALSTAEAEYISMSQALRETIPLATLMREMSEVFSVVLTSAQIHYQSARRQSVVYCNGQESKIFSSDQAHCYQISSFSEACYYSSKPGWVYFTLVLLHA